MTEFNPKNKETLSYEQTCGPAMEITDARDARQYLESYVAYVQKHLEKEPRDDDMTAEEIVLANLGYYAGYYSQETRKRVQKLFGAVHPILGDAHKNLTPDDVFNKGIEYSTRNQ